MTEAARVEAPRPAGGLRRRGELASRALLVLLLAALLLGAATFRHGAPRPWFGNEAGQLLQAASLAADRDLAIEPRDLERFEEWWGGPPDGARRIRAGAGRAEVAAGSLPYSLLLAPVVPWAPRRGPAVVNALLLALAAGLASRRLASRSCVGAELLIAVVIFGSVAFAWVFLALPETLALAATVAAFALATGGRPPPAHLLPEIYEPPERAPRVALRWLAAGALLAPAALAHPFFLALLWPAARAAPAERRRRARAWLVAGIAVPLAAAVLLYGAHGAGWSPWPEPGRLLEGGGPAGAGAEAIAVDPGPRPFDPAIRGWNLLYFAAGRHVGVLPYFLPLLLLGLAQRGGAKSADEKDADDGSGALINAAGAVALAFVVLVPFDFFGGPGTLANRWFLPLYGALWLLPRRSLHPGWIAACALLAGLFLWPLWLAPRAVPLDANGSLRYPAPLARWLLPYETTARSLPSGGEAMRREVWARALGPATGSAGDGWRLTLAPGGRGRILVASPYAAEAIYLEFGPGSPVELEVGGADVGTTIFRPDGSAAFQVLTRRPRARHSMWWGPDRQYLYELELAMPGAPDRSKRPHAFAVTTEHTQLLEGL